MRIGVNTRFLLSEKMEGFGWYTYEIVKRMVIDHPEHEFYFFFDRGYDPKFIFAPNVTPVILRPAARHPLLFIYWFELRIKRALKKHKVDVFFSPDGYVSLGSKVPQVATIHDINFEHHPSDLPFAARKYLRFFFPKFARKAAHILTVSEYSKKDICKTYAIDSNKVTAIWNGVSELYRPLSNEELTKVRNSYTAGSPYFIFVGSIHPRKNVIRLIEAFKLFKERSHSDLKLLIVGSAMWEMNKELSRLSSELKKELIFTGHVQQEELVKLVGAAFALTYVPYYEGFGIPIVEAMKCGVPVISGNLTSLPEVAGNAALYCDPLDTESIVNAMMQLTSQNSVYSDLKENGVKRSELFSWNLAANKVWDEIVKIKKVTSK